VLLDNIDPKKRLEEPQALKILRTGTNVFIEDCVRADKEKNIRLSDQERHYLQQKIDHIKKELDRELAHPEEIMSKGIGASISKRRAEEANNFG
jgi:hypothetical protein